MENESSLIEKENYIDSQIKISEPLRPITCLNDVLDRIKFNKKNILIYIFGCLLISAWGIETQFLSMNFIDYAMHQGIDEMTFSILFTVLNILSCFCGLLMGAKGRLYSRNKRIFAIGMIYLISVVLCNFFDNFYYIFILRCFANSNTCFILLLSTDILVEYLPNKNKNFHLNFAMGFIYVGGLYNIILFYSFRSEQKDDPKYITNNKIVNSLNCIPLIISMIFLMYIKDSPSFLIIIKREKEAFTLIEEMMNLSLGVEYNLENSKITYNFSDSLTIKSDKIPFTLSEEEKQNILKEFKVEKKEGLIYNHLFSKKYALTTIICVFLNSITSTIMTGCSFLILITLREYKGQTIDITERMQALIFGIILAFNGLIGGFISKIKIFSLKKTICLTCFICGIFQLSIFIFPYIYCIELAIFFVSATINVNVNYIYIAENYDPELRDVAQNFVQNIGLFVCSFGPYIVELLRKWISLRYTYFIYGISFFINFGVSIFLPEIKIQENS